jgi:hypothetical protein
MQARFRAGSVAARAAKSLSQPQEKATPAVAVVRDNQSRRVRRSKDMAIAPDI